jgi:WD40 repeat protein
MKEKKQEYGRLIRSSLMIALLVLTQSNPSWLQPTPSFTLTGHPGAVYGVAFSSDHSYLASCDEFGTIKIWTSSSSWSAAYQMSAGGFCVSMLQLPNGQIAAGGDSNLQIWSPLTNQNAPLRTLTGHTNWVVSLALSPNGLILASGSKDTTLKLWSYQTQTTSSMTLTGHTNEVRAVCFVSNQILASGSWDNTIKIWDISSG